MFVRSGRCLLLLGLCCVAGSVLGSDHDGVAIRDGLFHGTQGGDAIEPGIGPCSNPASGEECFVSCLQYVRSAMGGVEQLEVTRNAFMITKMTFESDLWSGVRVTAQLKSPEGYDLTAVSPTPVGDEIFLGSCKRSTTALGMRQQLLQASRLVTTNQITTGSIDDLVVGPCSPDSDGVTYLHPHCFVSCIVARDAQGPLAKLYQIMSSSNFNSDFVVRDLTTGREDSKPRLFINSCVRSKEAWDAVSAPSKPSGKVMTVKSGNLWSDRYGGDAERVAKVGQKGIPIGGEYTVALDKIKKAIARGAPAAGTETQRVSESPYILPKYRIEIAPVSGEIFVSMPVSQRYFEATGRLEITAEEYLKGLFDKRGAPGTLPQGTEDVAEPARTQFETECSWEDGGFLWAMSSIQGGQMHEFRVVIAPECILRNSPHWKKFGYRIVKHGDLIPMRLPSDPVKSAMDLRSGWTIAEPSMDTDANNRAIISRCVRASQALIHKTAGAGALPTWRQLTDPDESHLFSGSCRGVAYMAGELYFSNSGRGLSRVEQNRFRVLGPRLSREEFSESWLMDADSSYTFLRTDGIYTGAGVMGLLKTTLGAMGIPVGRLHVNVKGTDVTQDPQARDLVVPESIVGNIHQDPHTPLVRPDTLRGQAFPQAPPQFKIAKAKPVGGLAPPKVHAVVPAKPKVGLPKALKQPVPLKLKQGDDGKLAPHHPGREE